jgi:hypothetical protein
LSSNFLRYSVSIEDVIDCVSEGNAHLPAVGKQTIFGLIFAHNLVLQYKEDHTKGMLRSLKR